MPLAVDGVVETVETVGVVDEFLVAGLLRAVQVEVAGEHVVARRARGGDAVHQALRLHQSRGDVVVIIARLQVRDPEGDEHRVAAGEIRGVVVHRVSVDVAVRGGNEGVAVQGQLARVVENHIRNVAARVVGQRPVPVIVPAVGVDDIVENAVGIRHVAADLVDTEHVGHHILENGPQVGILLVQIVGGGVAVRHARVVGVIHQVVLHHPQGVLRVAGPKGGQKEGQQEDCFLLHNQMRRPVGSYFQAKVLTRWSASSRKYSMTGCRESLLGVKLK